MRIDHIELILLDKYILAAVPTLVWFISFEVGHCVTPRISLQIVCQDRHPPVGNTLSTSFSTMTETTPAVIGRYIYTMLLSFYTQDRTVRFMMEVHSQTG